MARGVHMYICTNVPIYHMLNKPADTAYTHTYVCTYTHAYVLYTTLIYQEAPARSADCQC